MIINNQYDYGVSFITKELSDLKIKRSEHDNLDKVQRSFLDLCIDKSVFKKIKLEERDPYDDLVREMSKTTIGYICTIHNSDSEICKIYECSGIKTVLKKREYNYFS